MENLIINKAIKEIYGLDVIKVALTYVNTPYHHLGRLKGVGIDCAGVIVETMKELGLDTSFDMKAYQRVADGLKLAQLCHNYAIMKPIKDGHYDFEDGDIILFNFVGNPQHLGFYYNNNGMDYFIHAYNDPLVNKVIKQRLDSKWKKRISGVFKIKGVV